MNNEIQKAVPIEKSFMGSNKVSTNLFSVETAEPVKIEQFGEKWEGNLDSVKWPELKKLSVEISKLLTGTFEFIDLNVGIKQYYRLQENKYYSGISIGLLGVELSQEKFDLIQSAGILLVNNMVENSNGTGTQVSSPGLGEVQIEQIGEQSHKFLEKFGGSKIRTPIVVLGKNLNIKCGGKYKEKPSVQIFAPISEKVLGKVDTISLHARKFEIIERDTGTKISVLFDMNNHFEKLRNLLGEESENEFTIQKEMDGKGVAINTLLEIDLKE
jgi:hypothetical protein